MTSILIEIIYDFNKFIDVVKILKHNAGNILWTKKNEFSFNFNYTLFYVELIKLYMEQRKLPNSNPTME